MFCISYRLLLKSKERLPGKALGNLLNIKYVQDISSSSSNSTNFRFTNKAVLITSIILNTGRLHRFKLSLLVIYRVWNKGIVSFTCAILFTPHAPCKVNIILHFRDEDT